MWVRGPGMIMGFSGEDIHKICGLTKIAVKSCNFQPTDYYGAAKGWYIARR